eukprot:gene1592-biopygen1476
MNGTPVFARVQYDRKMMIDAKLSRVIENFRATLGEFPSAMSSEFALYDGKKWVDGKKPETWQRTFLSSQRFGYLEIKQSETSEEEKQGLRKSDEELDVEKEMTDLKIRVDEMEREDKRQGNNAQLIGEILDEQKKLDGDLNEIRSNLKKDKRTLDELRLEQENVKVIINNLNQLLQRKRDKAEERDVGEMRFLEDKIVRNECKIAKLEENYYHGETTQGNLIWVIDDVEGQSNQ